MLLAGCTGMIPMYNISNEPVEQGLTMEQVEQSIELAGAGSGWRTQIVSPGTILATYNVRAHTVIVTITYDESYYSIDYKNSIEMKVKCPEDVGDPRKPAKVTQGQPVCAGGAIPVQIHGNYKGWVDGLNTAIITAMSSI
jgi:hypothetical protein